MSSASSRNRAVDALRPLTMEPGWAPYAEGSCLIATGQTRVLCTASVEERVPQWRVGSGLGWVTGEYSMLPRATHTRTGRERDGLRGRTQEIQRLIGRSLRSVTDLRLLGARTITLDCDVLQADGGTRTAAVTGAWVALALATRALLREGVIEANPILGQVAAVSVGLVEGRALLDLDYGEDSSAQVDMNLVGTERGAFVEVQGTAEGAPFTPEELEVLMAFGLAGIQTLCTAQREAVESAA
ncbi:MAG: ribonuclease PH [Gemmatimonadales bacterium]|nr:MAG: ribonuclease PH [Gemmatimonadales bacterium]